MILNRLATLFAGPSVGVPTSVASSASDVQILKPNAARKGAVFYNDSTAVFYLLLSSVTSSSSVYTVQLGANSYYELPVCQGGVYSGEIRGIWLSANGSVRVTEFI
jgi:hypothetical protein